MAVPLQGKRWPCKAADTRPTNVGQHVFAIAKSLSCVQKVGQHFMLANNVCHLRTCSLFVGQQAANRALRLVGCSKHHDAEWTDASCVDYTNYTSPFYHTVVQQNVVVCDTNVCQQLLLANICWSCVCGLKDERMATVPKVKQEMHHLKNLYAVM